MSCSIISYSALQLTLISICNILAAAAQSFEVLPTQSSVLMPCSS